MERNTDIFEHFIEMEDLRKDSRILCFIAYGSEAYNTSDDKSDVDILVIINGLQSYRVARLVEGKNLDIYALTLDEVKNHIIYERANGNQYVESVLRNGKVLINNEQSYEYLEDFLFREKTRMRFKRTINSAAASLAVEKCENFLDSNQNDNYTYFTALEMLRKVISVKLCASYISDYKAYKLYTNQEYAFEKYMVKLPGQSFIDLYLESLVASSLTERKSKLLKLLKYLIGTNIKDSVFVESEYESDSSIKKILVSANHLVIAAEDNLLKGTPCSDSLYYLALERINSIIKLIHKGETYFEYDNLFKDALKRVDVDERIKALEDLFHLASKKYEIDYDDFILTL